MKKTAEFLIISISVCLAIVLALIIFISQLFALEKSDVIETSCGDEFDVTYDSFRDKSIIADNNSLFSLIVKGEVTNEDFKVLQNSDGVKVYKVKYIAFFDIGNGFERFDGDLDKNREITLIVKNNLLYDYSFFSYNIGYFLDSAAYYNEAKLIIQSLCKKDYEQLSAYGLSESVINDSNEIDMIRQKALEYKRTHNLN